MRLTTTLLATAAALTLAAPAQAVLLNFTLTGSRSAMFQLDSNPTPTSSTGLQAFFALVPGTFGGVSGIAPSISFGTGLASEFEIVGTPLGFSQFSRPTAIFTGTTANPMFSVGTFALTSIVSGSSTLTITNAPVVAPIPEPATWAMLVLGFGLIGAAARRRRAGVMAAA